MSEIKPIRLALVAADPPAQSGLSAAPFRRAEAALRAALRGRPDPALEADLQSVADFLRMAEQLDADYGADARLPLVEPERAAEEALRALAGIAAVRARTGTAEEQTSWQTVIIGVGLWAMRHGLPLISPEPVVNALAERANAAQTTQDTAATYALMQGFIAHLAPQLKMDLERSNPERPWRMINLNFAITAIRSGDTALMRFAFDTLNEHLPGECAGFYQEALALASRPGFPAEARALIEAESRRDRRVH